MTFLITGVAGFIGAALAKSLIEKGERVVGLDHGLLRNVLWRIEKD